MGLKVLKTDSEGRNGAIALALGASALNLFLASHLSILNATANRSREDPLKDSMSLWKFFESDASYYERFRAKVFPLNCLHDEDYTIFLIRTLL